MSLRLEMLQVARLAPRLLGESAGLIRKFLVDQQNPDGGFKDRTGKSDLYYTVFALDSWIALGLEISELRCDPVAFLEIFSDGQELDFVHLCCLARARAGVRGPRRTKESDGKILARIEAYRSRDGGYGNGLNQPSGSVYGCFLGLGAYQDLGAEVPDSLRLVQCLKFLETPDGGWANDRAVPMGSVPATAAAVTLLRQLKLPVNPETGQWLLAQAHAQGGFCAVPGSPVPDLLSTATALHALAGLDVSFESIKESCLDFLDSLWTGEGSFHGHWEEEVLDCEYTFYGLLALGHLSL